MGVFASHARSVSVTALIAIGVLFQPLVAQDAAVPAPAANAVPNPADVGAVSEPGHPVAGQPVIDKRAFGVLPNYRTSEESIPFKPITTKQKFTIAMKDTFDYPSYVLAAAFAGISQLDNSNPSFGQGLKGYARRYASGVADQDIGNFMTEAVMPSLFHEDPRYFRRGQGSVGGRIMYAVSRVAVTKTDAGGRSFNFAEFLGNGTVAALGNAYYPDQVGFSSTMQRMFTQIGTDAISQVLKEFWPDVKRKWLHKKTDSSGANADD
jgi:hypothetical protein